MAPFLGLGRFAHPLLHSGSPLALSWPKKDASFAYPAAHANYDLHVQSTPKAILSKANIGYDNPMGTFKPSQWAVRAMALSFPLV